MVHKISGYTRRTPPLEISGACHNKALNLSDFPRDEARIRKGTDAHGNVQALIDKVQIAIVEHELDANFWICIEKGCNKWRDMQPPELNRSGEAQRASNGSALRRSKRIV